MRLYLSSYRIPTPREFFELFDGKQPDEIKLGIITDAKNDPNERYKLGEREEKLAKLEKDLGELGLGNLQRVSLSDYVDSQETFFSDLARFDGLYACGGNSFALRYAMKLSGFDNIFDKLQRRGQVYAGESAGAVVVGPSLEGYLEVDDDPVPPEQQITAGLNCIPQVPIVHYGDRIYGERNNELKAYLKAEDQEYITLTNNQAYIVNGTQAQRLTA